MAEATTYLFDFKEVAEALVKKQGLHEGNWGIGVEFGFAVQNIRTPTGDIVPAAVVPVQKIVLNRWDEPNNLTVNAAEVNPDPGFVVFTEIKDKGTRKGVTKKARKPS